MIIRKNKYIIVVYALGVVLLLSLAFSLFGSNSDEGESLQQMRKRMRKIAAKKSAEDATSLMTIFIIVDKYKGKLPETDSIESWQAIHKELSEDGAGYMIPMIEEYIKKVQATPNFEPTPTYTSKDITNSLPWKIVDKLMPGRLSESDEAKLERQEKTAKTVITMELGSILIFNSFPLEQGKKQILSSTKAKGFRGYYYIVVKEGDDIIGFIGNPCEYGKSGVFTYIVCEGGYKAYKKDLKGKELKTLPKSPKKGGWTRIDF